MKYNEIAFKRVDGREENVYGRLSELQKKIISICPARREVIVELLLLEGHTKQNIYRSIRLLMKYGFAYIQSKRNNLKTGYIKELTLNMSGFDILFDIERKNHDDKELIQKKREIYAMIRIKDRERHRKQKETIKYRKKNNLQSLTSLGGTFQIEKNLKNNE